MTDTRIVIKPDFQVNTVISGSQYSPSVAGLAGGGFVVTWGSPDADSGGDISGIRAQLYGATGAKIGTEFVVNSETTGVQWGATVTALGNGGFAVAWQDDNGANAIKVQRFDASGTATGGEVTVNSTTVGKQTDAAITALDDGGFFVTWVHPTGTGMPREIRGQRFDASGEPAGAEAVIGADAARDRIDPSVAGLEEGGYVVTWADLTGKAIKAQLYDEAGAAVGSEFAVNTAVGLSQTLPEVIALSTGGFVVTWTQNNTVHAQRFDAAGGRVGSDILVSSATGYRDFDSAIAATPDGGFTITWTRVTRVENAEGVLSSYSSGGIRHFDASGTAFASGLAYEGTGESAYQLNSTAIATLAGGGYAVVRTNLPFLYNDGFEDTKGSSVRAYVVASLSDGAPGEGNDSLTGTAGNDTIDGLGGIDMIAGLGGDDSLTGGAGDDSLSGDAGNDWLDGGEGADTLAGGSGNNMLDGGAGDDSVFGGQGADLIYGAAGDDSLYGNGGNDSLYGADGRDSLSGGAGNDVLRGGEGYDSLEGGSGDDALYVEVGDPISGGHYADGGDGDDFIHGRASSIMGGLGNDTIVAWASRGSISGGAGDDIISTDVGRVNLTLGAGRDIVSFRPDFNFSYAGSVVIEDYNPAEDVINLGNLIAGMTRYDGTSPFNTKHLRWTQSGSDAFLFVDMAGTGLPSAYKPLLWVKNAFWYDVRTSLNKTSELDDTVIGTAANDVLDGLAGNDWIRGLEGDDTLIGGDDADSLDGGEGNDSLVGGAGLDTLDGGAGNDFLGGDAAFAAEVYDGGDGNDTLRGHGDLSVATVSGIEQIDLATGGLELKATVQQLNAVSRLTYGGVVGAGGDGSAFVLANVGAIDFSGKIQAAIKVKASNLNTGNQIVATQWNDTLIGGTGHDHFTGGAGDDRYVVGVGAGRNDTIVAGSTGADQDVLEITGVTIDDVRMVRNGNDLLIRYGAGADSVLLSKHFAGDGTTQVRTLEVGGMAFELTQGLTFGGTSANDTLTGSAFADTLTAHGGADVVRGLGGDDVIKGGTGNDSLDGGAGNDRYLFAAGDGQDTVAAGVAGDADVIELNSAGVSFERSGNDLIIRHGAGGADTIRLAGHFTAAARVSTLVAGDMTYDLTSGLNLVGTAGADSLTGMILDDTLSGLGGADSLDGGLGNDSLDGGARWDTLRGGDGNDTLNGGLDNDIMYGGLGDDVYYVDHVGDRVNENVAVNEGNDTVFAAISWNMTANIESVVFTSTNNLSGTGNSLHNTMTGNAGNDTLNGGSGHDSLSGGDGNDSLDGGTENDLLDGGAGNDTLLGGQRWDTLSGGDGDDVLDGGTDSDRMSGGAGNDIYFADHVDDRAIEAAGEGTDLVYASVDFALWADVEHLTLTGTAVAGTGNGLGNRITGNGAANVLNGGHGNDTLMGGPGDDSLTGGTGRDDFVVGLGDGTDSVADFLHGIDRMVFAGADYGFAAGHRLTNAQFTAGGAAVGTSAQFVWDAATGRLNWDADGAGAGAGVNLAVLNGGAGLTKDDLFFV